MTSRFLMLLAAIMLFTVLAMPASLAAQNEAKQGHHHQYHHYKLIDIGTFGGPESFVVPNYEVGSPNPVSGRGTTVGAAGTPVSLNPNSNPFACGGIEGVVPFVNQAFKVKKNGDDGSWQSWGGQQL
jgi:hypothetical protein